MFFGKATTSKSVLSDLYLMARIVEHTPMNIIVTKNNGDILYANDCTELDLKYRRDKLHGLAVGSIISDAQDGTSWPQIQESLVKEKKCTARVTLICQGGNEIACLLHAFSIDNSVNNEQVFILEFKDITEEETAADQLERKNVEMAKINSELIRSNAELRRVSDLKSNFLSIASHELKTPLTSIKGYSDIIIDTMKDKIENSTYRMIESINRAADRLHRVVNNILDVTRIEQKRLRLKPEELDLTAVACECIDELNQFSAKRNIRFECNFQPDLPHFTGDLMRMQQMFTNLFSNAIKFSPDNSVVEVTVSRNTQGGFLIIVKDHGIGIDKAEHKKIFDPFYEVGSATRHSSDSSKFMGGGTGLGLSIVKGIVERHGGRIWVESVGTSQDKSGFLGSEFHIVLPIEAKIEWDDDETHTISLAEIQASQVSESNMAANDIEQKPILLYIDNDLEAVEISRMVLENVFEVIVASSGEEGLKIAFDRVPSVILVDSELPGLDVYRICRILRSQEETKNIPIAFVSASAQNSDIQKCFVSGADDYVVKPFSGQELVEKIWRLLMKKKEQQNFT